MNNPFEPSQEPKTSNPFAETPESQPLLSGGLSSNLGHQARNRQLNVARWILIGIGVLTAGFNLYQVQYVDQILAEEMKQIQEKGGNPAEIPPEVVEQAKSLIVFLASILIAVGIAYIIMGIVIYTFPVPITIAALVIYLASAAIFAVLDPTSIAQGLLIKILIIIALSKSIGAAIEYEKERRSVTF